MTLTNNLRTYTNQIMSLTKDLWLHNHQLTPTHKHTSLTNDAMAHEPPHDSHEPPHGSHELPLTRTTTSSDVAGESYVGSRETCLLWTNVWLTNYISTVTNQHMALTNYHLTLTTCNDICQSPKQSSNPSSWVFFHWNVAKRHYEL